MHQTPDPDSVTTLSAHSGTGKAESAVDPWALIEKARHGLSRGGPDQLRVLIARALGSLGLAEPARMWADTIPRTPELLPLIRQIEAALPALQPSLLPIQMLEERLRSRLRVRPDIQSQIGESLGDWLATQESRLWFRALDGRQLIVDRTRPIDSPITSPNPGMRIMDEPIEQAGRSMLVNEIFNGGPPPPIVLDGIRSGASVADICQRFHRLSNRAWARIYAAEPDPFRVFDALVSPALDDHLGEDRLRFLVGPGCHDRLLEQLKREDDQWAKLTYLPGDPKPTSDAPIAGAFRTKLQRLTHARAEEYRSLCAANNAEYAHRDPGWWSERFRGAISGSQPPLRVLVPTTRYSTYIQHASRDIVNAINGRGFEARLLVEHDDSSLREGLSMARAIHRFKPDVMIVTNYTRSTFADSVPSQIPHVCWIQDELSHLFTDTIRHEVDELTLLVGNIYTSLIATHGVPQDRCLSLGVPASSTKFEAAAQPRPSCDLFIATNHGESPLDLRDRLCEDCVRAGGPPALIPDMHERIERQLPAWRTGYLVTWLLGVLEPIFQEHGIPTESRTATALLREAAIPLVNRMLRHRLLGWAADLAESEGLTLRVAGRGWESHPRLARYSIGEVPHGPALRDELSDALLTLQASAASLHHQRIHEALLAGSMPALMVTPDNVGAILRPARAAIVHEPPTLSTTDDRMLRARAWDHPIIALSLSTAQRVMTAERIAECFTNNPEYRAIREGIIMWRTGAPVSLPNIREGVPLMEQARFLDAISPGMFWDRQQLLALVRRARAHPDWRIAQIRHARAISQRSFTYEHAADQIIRTLGDQLARAASARVRKP